jgi:hypothetical protein
MGATTLFGVPAAHPANNKRGLHIKDLRKDLLPMNTFRISLFVMALASAALAGTAPTPFGAIAGVALTGSGSGQFAQSSPQQGEIQFDFTLDNGEIISGEVCSFGATTCVANGTGASFDSAAPVLYASFTVGCGEANCAAFAYNLSADYQFDGNVLGSDSASGSFASNDIEGMNAGDAMSFHGAIGGSAILPSGGFTVDPTSGVDSYPFSGSDGPDNFINGGSTITANLNGSITIAGAEDTLHFSGDVSLQAASTPEPAAFGLALIGFTSFIFLARRNVTQRRRPIKLRVG